MPTLKNPRHELYAQALACGKRPCEAIGLAGYKPDPRNASRLTHHPDIVRRISELQNLMAARTQKKIEYTREWVIEQLIDNVDQAKAKEDFSAANNALKLLGLEREMFTERREIKHGDLSDMSADQLRDMIVASFTKADLEGFIAVIPEEDTPEPTHDGPGSTN